MNLFKLPEQEKELREVFFLILKKLLRMDVQPSCYTPKLLDQAGVMRILNISRSTLYRMKKRGDLVPARIGGHDYYREDDLQKFF